MQKPPQQQMIDEFVRSSFGLSLQPVEEPDEETNDPPVEGKDEKSECQDIVNLIM